MSPAATERRLRCIALGSQERLGGLGWGDLKKVEGKALKPRSYFKGI